MADTMVTELPEALSVGEEDLLYLVQDDTSKKIPKSTLKNEMKSDELIDIRTGANGVTYANSGESVRTQYEINENRFNKQLALVDTTYYNGRLRKNGTVDTSDAAFFRVIYTLNGEKTLHLKGFNYNDNFPLWVALDANDNVIDYSQGLPPQSDEAQDIYIKENYIKIVLNCYKWSTNRFQSIYKYANGDTVLNDIKKSAINYGGILHWGYVYHANNGSTSNDAYCYLECDLTEGEYYVSGTHASVSYPLVMVFDSNNNIIYRTMGATSYTAVDEKITIPSGTHKVVVNSKYSEFRLPCIKKKTNDVNNFSSNSDNDIRNKNIKLKRKQITVNYGGVKNKDGTVNSSNADYIYCVSNIVGGNQYYVTGRNYSKNYPLYLFADANDNIIWTSYDLQLANNTLFFNVKVQAPLNASKIYINSIKGADFALMEDDGENFYTFTKGKMLSDTYLGHTPVKNITDDENFRSYNLSKFSNAYGVMLDRIMTTYPLAKVVCCTINECERKTEEIGFPDRNIIGETIEDYNYVIRKLSHAFGCILVDHHRCGITYYNLSEYMYDYDSSTKFGLHPNKAGMKLISDETYAQLINYNLSGEKVAVYGDSISTFNGTGSNPNQYPAGDVLNVEDTWWYDSLITRLGMTLLTNASGGGRTVANIREGVTNRPKSGYNQDAINAMTVDGVTPDIIVIKLGVNDFGNVGSGGNLDLDGKYFFGGI